ncbi:hypothetical protein NUW58_g2650 [Xylaria curta]|uniref:Uncharacterized protein n=1 Tax=Xylaria curta TaxID=42375 RepID=A0ACC1PGD9_9PEZI|nr:hypothetical protein NUW58_g2650 [Xylaria curta]
MRGLRIELSEVEYQVRECIPGVSQAIAEVTELAGENNRPILSVFLQVDGDDDKTDGIISSPFRTISGVTENAALAWLRPETEAAISQRLPAYMVPTLYFQLEKLPLSTAGKVDRRKLREIVSALSSQNVAELKSLAKGHKRAPRTQTEQTLQRLWAQILDISGATIGVDDNFLGLGGDSITAMKLVVSARKAGVALTVMDVLKQGSLEALAAHQDQKVRETGPSLSVEPFSLLDPAQRDDIIQWSKQYFAPQEVADIYPLTGFQRDVIKMSLQWPRESLNYIFIDLGPRLDLDRLKRSCHRLVERYSLLRSAFIHYEGTYLQVALAQLQLQFPVFDAAEDIASVSREVCLADAESGFQLGHPPTAFMLVRSKSQGHRLIFRLSHLQYDGFCLSTVITALLDLYQGISPPSVTQFSDFLGHKRDRLAVSSAYWKRILQGSTLTKISEILLPEASHAAIRASPREKVIVEDSIRIKQLPEGVTLASIVSSAWAIVLARLTGQKDVVYGSLVSGRDVSMPGIENVVGPCLDIVPVRVQISSNQVASELFQSIQEQNLAAQANSLGLDEIVKCSTDWPVESDFESTVQHQNADENQDFDRTEGRVKLSWMDNPNQVPPRMVIMSYPTKGGVRVKLVANSHITTAAMAKTLVAALWPKLAAISRAYEFYHDAIRNGMYIWEIEKMHEQYGPVVRISPREVHIKDPYFHDEVYAPASKRREKDPQFVGVFGFSTSMIATVSHELHRFRRSMLNNFFSKRSVLDLAFIMHEKEEKLIQRFEKAHHDDAVLRLDDAYAALTADVISQYSWGVSSGFLDDENFKNDIREALNEISEFVHYNRFFPVLGDMMRAMPRWLVARIRPGSAAVLDMQDMVTRSSAQKPEGVVRKTIFDALSDVRLPSQERSTRRLEDEGLILVVAGTETTARTLTVASYHIFNSKPLLLKIRSEIKTVMPNPTTKASWSELEQLPYLNAVVNEAIRLSHGPIFRSARIAPTESLIYKGLEIPPGWPVSMSSFFVHMDPNIFPEPNSFKPERWIEAAENDKHLNKFLVSFGKGSRICLGLRSLAYAELYMTLACLIRRFEIELYESKPDDIRIEREMGIGQPNKGEFAVRAKITKIITE